MAYNISAVLAVTMINLWSIK